MMRKVVLFLCLVIPILACGQDVRIVQKPAELRMPEEIACKLGASSYSLSGEISFRWDESTPLAITLWRGGWETDDKAGYIMGHSEFFDEEGKSLLQWGTLAMMPPTQGKMIVQPGERRECGFLTWDSYVRFPRPGRYCVVAEFLVLWKEDTIIAFKTERRWFKVVETPPDLKE